MSLLSLQNPTFVVYAITCLVLSANMLVLWAYSGVVRTKTKTAVNKEDAAQFKVKLVDDNPEEVARVLRAHANASATNYLFLFLGLIFVVAGGAPMFAKIVFGVFAATRILHSIVYLAGKQPWRTLMFVIAGGALAVLMGDIVWLMIQV